MPVGKLKKAKKETSYPIKRWLTQLVQPGSSLGGARPKASVVDTDKVLYVAKFPSRKDDYNAGLWEHFCHLLAKKAGINAASTQVISTSDKLPRSYHVALIEPTTADEYILLLR